jgi:hypothetical protein
VALGLVLLCLTGAAVALASTSSNRQVARANVQRVLASLMLPPGAVRTKVDPAPGTTLSRPSLATATPVRVDVHGFWRVPGAPADVIDWIRAHPPMGSLGAVGTGISARHGVPYAWSVVFTFRGIPTVLRSRTLAVTATAARGGGTALRADAEVVWSVVRPRWERIPAGVRIVRITDERLGRPGAAPQTVTGRRKVDRIVALINRLPQLQPGVFSCPADRGPDVGLSFETAPAAAPVAIAHADGSGCGVVTLRVRGRTAPALSGGPGVIKALDRLLGARL